MMRSLPVASGGGEGGFDRIEMSTQLDPAQTSEELYRQSSHVAGRSGGGASGGSAGGGGVGGGGARGGVVGGGRKGGGGGGTGGGSAGGGCGGSGGRGGGGALGGGMSGGDGAMQQPAQELQALGRLVHGTFWKMVQGMNPWQRFWQAVEERSNAASGRASETAEGGDDAVGRACDRRVIAPAQQPAHASHCVGSSAHCVVAKVLQGMNPRHTFSHASSGSAARVREAGGGNEGFTNGGKVTDRCVARFVAPSPEADSMSPMIMSAEPPSPEPVSPATPTSMSPLKGAGGEP